MFAAQHAAEYDTVACIGGDGTLSEVVSGLMQVPNPPPLGYIPMGTTNDVASTLGLPKNATDAALRIVTGTPTAFDVGSFGEQSFFTYVAAFGAFTAVSYETPQNEKQALGHLAYVLEAMGRAQQPSTTTARTWSTTAARSTGDFIFGGVSNSTSVAGMVRLRKDLVSLGDGLFETLLIRRPKQFGDLSRIITGVLNQYYDNENVILVQSKNLRFTFEEPVAWTRDGEAGGVTTDVTAAATTTRRSTSSHNSKSLSKTGGKSAGFVFVRARSG